MRRQATMAGTAAAETAVTGEQIELGAALATEIVRRNEDRETSTKLQGSARGSEPFDNHQGEIVQVALFP